MSNALVLAQLLLQYTLKAQEIARLFQQANLEGRDVTDAEVATSTLARDAALARLQGAIDAS